MREPETPGQPLPLVASVAGIILAAGESSRMGRHKALLPLGPRTFVEHLAEALSGEVSPLVIVLGYHASEIEAQLPPQLRPSVLRNPDYRLGQLSSLKVAVRALLDQDVAGAVVCLVDTPAIHKQVVRAILERFRETRAPVIIPTYRGRRGHPVLFAKKLFPELLEAPVDQGARVVVQRYADQIQCVETTEEGILLDIDRPQDYQALLARWAELSGAPRRPPEEPS